MTGPIDEPVVGGERPGGVPPCEGDVGEPLLGLEGGSGAGVRHGEGGPVVGDLQLRALDVSQLALQPGDLGLGGFHVSIQLLGLVPERSGDAPCRGGHQIRHEPIPPRHELVPALHRQPQLLTHLGGAVVDALVGPLDDHSQQFLVVGQTGKSAYRGLLDEFSPPRSLLAIVPSRAPRVAVVVVLLLLGAAAFEDGPTGAAADDALQHVIVVLRREGVCRLYPVLLQQLLCPLEQVGVHDGLPRGWHEPVALLLG